METLFSNKFNDIVYNEQNGIHYHITKEATSSMSEQEFREMLLNWKKVMSESQVKLILVDNRNFQFPISPELQTWTAQNISTPVLALDSVQKFCFVLPEEFIAQLSISQLTSESNNISQAEQLKYFANPEQAEEWLLADA